MSGIYGNGPDLDLTDRLVNADSLLLQEPDEEDDDEEDDDRKKEDADDDDEGDDGYSELPCGTVTVLEEPDAGSAEQHMFFRFPQ
jgi:hypothetical protein